MNEELAPGRVGKQKGVDALFLGSSCTWQFFRHSERATLAIFPLSETRTVNGSGSKVKKM